MAVNLNVTELDFEKIKANLKDHLSSQSTYADYDFEGSGLSVLIDLLAYNTHYNAMIAHLALNEAFLDSAQIRGNVVSHAKLLGYVPKSRVGSTAYINIDVTDVVGTPIPSTITLDRGSKFVSVIDGEEYTFVAVDSVTQLYDSDNEGYFFKNIPIKQGSFKTVMYRVDELLANQKFELPDEDADISTMRVRIRENDNSTQYTIYTLANTLTGIDHTSKVFFLQENSNSKYEIYFGDGLLGYKPTNNNIVEIEYVYTEGTLGNGAASFSIIGNIGGNSTIEITTVNNSSGGTERETVESIRFNAPLSYITQNRAVTADDYKAIIKREYGDVDAISVWGGEQAIPPDYGKVYISIKPHSGPTLNSSEKEYIANTILKNKNVVSITPVLVDPDYTYIALETFFKYNPNLTDLKLAELKTLVLDQIIKYNNDELKKFDGVFRYSKLLRQIDSVDPSILNSFARVYMFKEVSAIGGQQNQYTLNFSSPIYGKTDTGSVIDSTPFVVNGITYYFADQYVNGLDYRQLYIYKIVNNKNVTVIANAGKVYTSTGVVVVNPFTLDSNTTIRFTIVPNSNDLAPRRNQLLEISELDVSVVGEVDTIAVSGSTGAINYTTTSRHK